MATVEKGGIFTLKGSDGNLYLLYPVTKKANISDLEEATQKESGLLSPKDKVKLDALLLNGIGYDERGIYIDVDTPNE